MNIEARKKKYGAASLLPINQPGEFDKLEEEQKQQVLYWIRERIVPHKVKSYKDYSPSSYQLKHLFQWSDCGFYMTNGAFKGAMLAAGFEPRDPLGTNWTFMLGRRAGEGPRRYARVG